MTIEETPTLYDANQALHKGVLVGEDENVLTGLVSFIFSDQPVIIEGFSGAGKSIMADAIWDLIPTHQKFTYQMGTEKAIWRSTKFQTADYVLFSEWQKAAQNLDVVEAAKQWGEGKEYTREVSVQVDGEWVTEEAILPPRPFLTTFADENEDAEIGDEVARRAIKLYADPSRTQTEKVVNDKAETFSNPWAIDDVPEETVGAVRRRVNDVAGETLQDVALPGFKEAFVEKLPMEFHDTRSVIDHFFNVISGVARFYGPARTTHEGYLLATPSDLFEAFEIYKESLLNNCLRLENLGSRVLACFPKVATDDQYDENAMMTVDDVMEELKHQGIMLPKNKVKSIVVKLCMTGYLTEDSTMATPHYHRAGVAENPDDLIVDWGTVIDTVIDAARETLPPNVSGRYINNVKKNQKVVHPVSGDEVLLTDYTASMDASEEEAETVKSKTKETADQHQDITKLGVDW